METVSPERVESTRKNGARIQSVVLRRLAVVTQDRAAAFMEVSPSTVSRTKEDLDKVCHLLAALGLQIAPIDSVVMSQDDIRALERMAYKYLQSKVDESEEG
ncbi:MAG: CII family transcriptional regulator [Paenalcaligenes sp.]